MNIQTDEKKIINIILNGYGLDHEFAVYAEIIETCGLNFDDEYIEDESLLTPELLESHYGDIFHLIRSKNLLYEDLPYSDRLVYMVLGALIILTKAHLPEDFRDRIIDSADWEFELKNRWRKVNDEFIENRKKVLTYFQEILKNHEAGKITDVDHYIISAKYDYVGMGYKFLKACSLDSLEDITQDILEANLDKIIFLIEKEPPFDPYGDYLILGALILKTGASIQEDLRQKIIKVADWEEEVKQRWNLRDEEFLEERKQVLIAFQNIVRRYKS